MQQPPLEPDRLPSPPLEPDRFWEPPLEKDSAPTPAPLQGRGRALFKVLLGSTLAGLMIIGSLVYFYGSRSNELEKFLLSPRALRKMTGDERGSCIFEKILFKPAGSSKAYDISYDSYVQFYNRIRHDKALSIVPIDIEARFTDKNTAYLEIIARPPHQASHFIFQNIEILQDGHYRLKDGAHWKYFYRKDIGKALDPRQ